MTIDPSVRWGYVFDYMNADKASKLKRAREEAR